MSCPRCGGADRTPLARGYWRCAARVVEHRTVTRTVPVDPGPYVPDINLLTSLRAMPSTLSTLYRGPAELNPVRSRYSDAWIMAILRWGLDGSDFDRLVALRLHESSPVIRFVAGEMLEHRRHPAFRPVATAVAEERACGHDYQDGPPTDTTLSCDCGYFAVGRCKECARPVCGVHSALRSDRLLCREHLRADDAARAAAAEAQARARAEQEAREAADRAARDSAAVAAAEAEMRAGTHACVWLTCSRRGRRTVASRCPECGMPTEPVP